MSHDPCGPIVLEPLALLDVLEVKLAQDDTVRASMQKPFMSGQGP